MLICVDQISGRNLSAEDLHIAIKFNGLNGRVAHAQSSSNRLQPGVRHFIDITNCTVGDRADTAQGLMNIGVHLTPE